VDRARVLELIAAKVGETEQREDARIVGVEEQRRSKRLLRFFDLALLEQVAAAQDSLFDRLSIGRGSCHRTNDFTISRTLSRQRSEKRSTVRFPVAETVTTMAPEISVRSTSAPAACQRATTADDGNPNRFATPHEITAMPG